MPRQITWENRARSKRASLDAAIPPQWRLNPTDISADDARDISQLPRKFLTGFEIAVTETRPLEILNNMHTGVWSAEDVTRAFCRRAAVAHQLVNCLTEILFTTAIEQAKALDQHRLATGGLKGPLHGLPISFMDRFRIAGVETGAGYIGWLGKLEDAASESLLVKQMRSLGAIPFCKTNMPMSMMLGETSNNITGSTGSPFVRCLSSGGAAGGTFIPATCSAAVDDLQERVHFWLCVDRHLAGPPKSLARPEYLQHSTAYTPCGCLLGASHLWAWQRAQMQGVPLCGITIAPMCTDLAFLKYAMKCVIGRQTTQEDHALIDIPWRANLFELRQVSDYRPTFAVFRCDGNVMPHPPIQRALDMTVLALQSQGFEVIEWQPPLHEPAVRTLFEIFGSDGARGIRAALQLSGEPPVQQLAQWYFQQDNGPSPTSDFWELCQKREEDLNTYHQYWNSTKDITLSKRPVDGVIMPVAANVAALENDLTYFVYSAIVNLLDYSAGSFPVTKVNKDIDIKTPRKPFNQTDSSIWQKYDPQSFDGSPVGLQIMVRRLQEEKVLELLECVGNALSHL